MSERYRLYYCRAFGLRPDQFGPDHHPTADPDTKPDHPATSASARTAAHPLGDILREVRDNFSEGFEGL